MKRAAGAYLLILVVLCLLVSLINPSSLTETSMDQVLGGPSIAAPFGFDSLGRDVFLRTIAGAKTSLGIGLLSATLAFFIALVVGAISAELGGRNDQIIMRFVEIIQSLPSLVFSAVVILSLKAFLPQLSMSVILIVSLALTHWMSLAKMTRNLIHQEKPQLYVEAARSLGASRARILFRHLLPNVLPTLLIFWGLQIPSSLMAEGVFTFLGFGIQSPETSWGMLIQEGWRMLATNPNLMLGPCLVLTLTVLSINQLVDKANR